MKQYSALERRESCVTEIPPESERLGFWQLWNINFGCFGIQFAWTLQMANTSAIYEYLGANIEQIPLLWLAAPISGLVVQPIVGYMSDRTKSPWGRRRPYLLAGAIVGSVCAILMPNASNLWLAAVLLLVLDTAINVSMQPFRAFVVDLLPEDRVAEGFAWQSFFIGLSSVFAAIAPWTIGNFIEREGIDSLTVPPTVKYSFYLGAIVYLVTILWTVVTTSEEKEIKIPQHSGGGLPGVKEIWQNMPPIMEKLAVVQFFTWLGVFCIMLYLPSAIAHDIFGAASTGEQLYARGIEWAGFCIAVYNVSCFLVSGILPRLSERFGCETTHALCLTCGGVAMISLFFLHDPYSILLPAVGFGVAWASILSLPYAIVADSIPKQDLGLYMGVFNIFVVIPQIIVSLGLGWVMSHYFNSSALLAVVFGGFFLLVAAISVLLLKLDSASLG